MAMMDGTTTFEPFSKYPPVFKDISLIQDEKTPEPSSFQV
jgi:phenylalanyl-tRNA synthetase beta subunit